MPARSVHCPQDGDRAASGVDGTGENDEFVLSAELVGLGPSDGQDEPVGVVVDVGGVQRADLAAAQSSDEADELQGSVAGARQVGFGGPGRGSSRFWW